MPMIEMATLSPAAQLCLKTADTHRGLCISAAGAAGRMTDTCGPSPAFAVSTVLPLLTANLLRPSEFDICVLELTDLGMALVDHGRYIHGGRR